MHLACSGLLLHFSILVFPSIRGVRPYAVCNESISTSARFELMFGVVGHQIKSHGIFIFVFFLCFFFPSGATLAYLGTIAKLLV